MESFEFKYNKKDGSISSIRVDFGGIDDSVIIKSHFIRQLERHNLLFEYNKDVFFIIAKAITLKRENSRTVSGCRSPYNLGNNEEFSELFVKRLYQILFYYNISIETVVSFFKEYKIEDLNNFINQPSMLEFLTFEKNFN